MKIIKQNRGDTIVEVMVAIVILGAAVGAAFTMSNKSKITTQDNHERYQAQLYANKQIEVLRNKYYNYTSAGGSRSNFKIDNTDPPVGCFDLSSLWRSDTNSACNDIDGIYDIRVAYKTPVSLGGVAKTSPSYTLVQPLTYEIRVTWDKIGGGQGGLVTYYGL